MRTSKVVACTKQLLGTSLLGVLFHSDISQTSAVGFAGGVKIYQNPEFSQHPWQPSTVELQAAPIEESSSGQREPMVVFYFETSRAEGLASFRQIAANCGNKRIPGECRNMTAVGGFATWSIQRKEVVELVERKSLNFLMLPP